MILRTFKMRILILIVCIHLVYGWKVKFSPPPVDNGDSDKLNLKMHETFELPIEISGKFTKLTSKYVYISCEFVIIVDALMSYDDKVPLRFPLHYCYRRPVRFGVFEFEN